MQKEEFIKLVASVLEIGAIDLEMTSNLEVLGWDSLSSLTFIAKIDEAMQVSIDADSLSRAVTIQDLYLLVSE
jgi:acyl carrier protein